MEQHKKRLRQILSLDSKLRLQENVSKHVSSSKVPITSDKIKQMERNDQIYRENLRIYSNINEIMNRRSNSVTMNDKAGEVRELESKQQTKNYFVLRNKGMTKLKLNPIKREVVLNKQAITARKNS